jgi:hypothetical protein
VRRPRELSRGGFRRYCLLQHSRGGFLWERTGAVGTRLGTSRLPRLLLLRPRLDGRACRLLGGALKEGHGALLRGVQCLCHEGRHVTSLQGGL